MCEQLLPSTTVILAAVAVALLTPEMRQGFVVAVCVGTLFLMLTFGLVETVATLEYSFRYLDNVYLCGQPFAQYMWLGFLLGAGYTARPAQKR
jgi:hypothetical protein